MNKKEMELALGYLQKRCDELEAQVDRLEERFENISIKDCPKCKNTRLVQRCGIIGGKSPYTPSAQPYQCLVCGTKFTCSTKEVCEII